MYMCPMYCFLSFRVKSLLTAPRYSKASTPKYFSVYNVFLLPLASFVLISWRDSEQHDCSRDPLLIRSWALFHPKDKAWEGVLPGSVGWEEEEQRKVFMFNSKSNVIVLSCPILTNSKIDLVTFSK